MCTLENRNNMKIEQKSLNLSARLRVIVLEKTDEYRRFKQLEVLTSIATNAWKNWYHGRQRPTAEMIESAAKLWPEYAFWLATGISDAEYGHSAPGLNGFPEEGKAQSNSARYFAVVREYYDEALSANEIFWKQELDNDVEKYYPDIIKDENLRHLYSDAQLPIEIVDKLALMRNEVKKAMKLRKAEILLNLEDRLNNN